MRNFARGPMLEAWVLRWWCWSWSTNPFGDGKSVRRLLLGPSRDRIPTPRGLDCNRTNIDMKGSLTTATADNGAAARAAAIRKAVRAIKRGSFLSYGEVARRAGLPGRARLGGQVLGAAGGVARLPWLRVTGGGGGSAVPRARAGPRA